ncbi:MAG: hypothetical protein QXD37_01340 [Zestosphaera sp.]
MGLLPLLFFTLFPLFFPPFLLFFFPPLFLKHKAHHVYVCGGF